MGSKNAPLTVIEFSDYECPFCKRSFNDVIPNLKKDYIDTGKVKFVYRDLPLSFHQNAHKEAQAAECARAQGGDSVYFKYHDQIFTKTTSNGTGIALDQLPVIAKDLGLNVSKFQQCLDSDKFKTEVDKDIADATAAGASGTPTWFIGKSTSNGTIDGTRIVGAQPYAAFKTVIDQQLK
ncbi:MAG: DsbA family protein [Candidatus Doudnabacteria bacterium]|nr:DsbA family protein [Candidatus Doudnabacteria bacterium]